MSKHQHQQQRAQRRHMRKQFGWAARLARRRSQGLVAAPPEPRQQSNSPLVRMMEDMMHKSMMDLCRQTLLRQHMHELPKTSMVVRPAIYAPLVESGFEWTNPQAAADRYFSQWSADEAAQTAFVSSEPKAG